MTGTTVTVWVTGCARGSGPFVHVVERPSAVDIEVTFRDSHTVFGTGGCGMIAKQLVVPLRRPLGDRQLTGCREPDCRRIVTPEGS